MTVCLFPGCRQSTQLESWIDGEWKYNSVETLRRQTVGNPVNDDIWQKLLDMDADNLNDCLVISEQQKTFKYLALQIDLVEEERTPDSVSFRGTGENKNATLIARKMNQGQIDITLRYTLPSGEVDESKMGLFDRVR